MDGPSHHLAAIMFTDIVGYSAIMGRDEKFALELLAENRRIHLEQIESFGGDLLKEMGDGNLIHFHSALDAVACALKIQESAQKLLKAQLRIGIHLGEVVLQDHDAFGDGVNIASRIQDATDPGGIYISEAVQKAIRSSGEIKSKYLDEVRLKNIDYPIKLYALTAPFLPTPDLSRLNQFDDSRLKIKNIFKNRVNQVIAILLVVFVGSGIWWIRQNNREEVRIAILPVEYLSPMDEAQYISAGIHSAMIDELSKISSLIVTSRTSSNKYRNHEKSIPEIASELNVKLIIESELIEIRDSLRIKIRLIQANPEEKQLWRREYYRPTKEILAVYGDMALGVSEVADLKITEEEKNDLVTFEQVDPDAYQAYLAGMGYVYEFSPNSINKALQYFDLSLAKDNEYAPAYTGIAMVWGVRMQFGYVSKQEAKAKIIAAYEKALEFDQGTALMHYNLAINNAWFFWDWAEADRQFQKTIELDPHDAETRAYYAHFLNFMHRFDEAKIQADEALKLQPTNTTIRTLYAMHLNHSKEYAKAIKILKQTLETDPDYGMALAALWTVYHNSNQFDKAAEAAKIRYATKGETEVVDILINNYIDYGYEHAMEQIAEAFIKKRDSSYVTPWQIATLYVRANNTEMSLNWLEKALEAEDPNMPYINCDPIFDKIRETDGFQRLLKKMALPKD